MVTIALWTLLFTEISFWHTCFILFHLSNVLVDLERNMNKTLLSVQCSECIINNITRHSVSKKVSVMLMIKILNELKGIYMYQSIIIICLWVIGKTYWWQIMCNVVWSVLNPNFTHKNGSQPIKFLKWQQTSFHYAHWGMKHIYVWNNWQPRLIVTK